MWHAWERRGKCTRIWWESPNEIEHSEDQGVGGKWDQTESYEDWFGGCGLDYTSSGQGPVAGFLSVVMNLWFLAP
jgi:hypothetical protein